MNFTLGFVNRNKRILNFSASAINLFSALPPLLQYFSLNNYSNNQNSTDLEDFYTVHKLGFRIRDGLNTMTEYMIISFFVDNNHALAYGLEQKNIFNYY